MNDVDLRQSEVDETYHCDVKPGRCAGDGLFVVANQSAAMDQPSEGSLHDPPLWKHLESSGRVRRFDQFDLNFARNSVANLENSGPLKRPSTHTFLNQAKCPNASAYSFLPTFRSVVSAVVTKMAMTYPSMSTITKRLRALVLLAAAYPTSAVMPADRTV